MHRPAESEPAADTMFTLRRVGGAGVIALTCPALRERQAHLLAVYLADLAERLEGRLVLDVRGVSEFSCAWINAMLDLSARCVAHGGQLIVVGLSRPSRRMLASTGLLARLRVARCTNAALRRLGVPVLDSWRLTAARWLGIPVDRMAVMARAA